MKKRQIAAVLAAGIMAASLVLPALAAGLDDLPEIDEEWEDSDWEDDDLDSLPDIADDDTPTVTPSHPETYDPLDDQDSMDTFDYTPLSGNGTLTATVNFREKPGTDSRILCTIPKGTVVPVSLLTDSGWYKVTYAGLRGYVSEKYLIMAGTSRMDIDAPDEGETATPVISTGVVIEQSNFRDAPGYDSNIIGAIDPGEKVDILGETEGGWYRIYYKGNIGYIYHGLVETSRRTSGKANVTIGVNFRSEPNPDDDSNIIGGIPAGAQIRILESTYNNWYKVEYEGVTGYVYGAYVDM